MENERHLPGLFLHGGEGLEREPLPVGGIFAVDVADPGGEHRHAEIRDLLALVGVGALAHPDHAVLFAADRADLGFERHPLLAADADEFGGFLDVFVDRIVRTVEHNGGKAGVDALEAALVGAVVEVERDRNGDLHLPDHRTHHRGDGAEAAHILARALRDAENDRGTEFLRGLKDRLRPFEIVDVELTDGVFARHRLFKHFLCRNQHLCFLPAKLFFHFLFYINPGEKSSAFSLFRGFFRVGLPAPGTNTKNRVFSAFLLTVANEKYII